MLFVWLRMLSIPSTQSALLEEYFCRNGEKCKMHKIDWCEGGLQLVDILANTFGENDLNPRIQNIMLRIEKW